MTKVVSYVEIDIDRCSRTFGSLPCRAALDNDLVAIYDTNSPVRLMDFNFEDGSASLHGWTTTNYGGSGSPANPQTLVGGASYATFSENGASDAVLLSPAINLLGTDFTHVEIDVERTANGSTWDGVVFMYPTTGGGYYYANFASPALNTRTTIVVPLDVGNGSYAGMAPGGGASGAYTTKTFNQLRVDFDQTGSGAFKIYAIRVCKRANHVGVNLFTQSEDLSHSDWSKGDVTITANAAVAPNGDKSADKIVESATTAQHLLYEQVLPTDQVVGEKFTVSCYFKSAERSGAMLTMWGQSYLYVNLTTGACTISGSGTDVVDYGAIDAGSGWWRAWITYRKANNAYRYAYIGLTNGTTHNYAGNGTSGIYAWGAQLERGELTEYDSTRYTTETATGANKCFNSLGSCQDTENFLDGGVTLRFGMPTSFLPSDIECIPALEAVSISPAILNPGVDIGKRSSVRVTLRDHRDSDTGPNGDPYLSDRWYDPYNQGTFFGKFRARHPYLRGKALRVIRGEVGQDIEAMETRHFIIDSFDGPLADGTFTITAKDPIKFADSDRSQAPLPSEGYTNAAVTDTDTTVTLLPTGVGTDYEVSGYASLGGKEIVYFEHDIYAGKTANTQLLFHFNGTDASTTITDDSGNSRTGTCVGNAQLDTAAKKYGSASLLLDGTGDYVTVPDNAAWTFSGDFTIDFWFRPNSVSTRQHLFSHSTDGSNYYQGVMGSNGSLEFAVVNAGVALFSTIASAAGIMSNGQWQHLAFVRIGNDWRIYRNGVSVASATASGSIGNYTGTFRIGTGPIAGNDCVNGWIDEFRVQSAAQWTAAFSDALPGPYTTSTDIFTITRAEYNTVSSPHSSESRFQQGLLFSGDDPAEILYTLLTDYAGVDATLINLSEWLLETESFFGSLFAALIPEPTSVVTLINEIIEQAGLALWWDDINQNIRLKVLQPISTPEVVWDDGLYADTISVKDQPDKRLSQVWCYFAQINPLRPLDETDNYRSLAVEADLDAETNYGSPAIKKIKSRWISTGGRATATRLNQLLLARYIDPPRRVTLELPRDNVQNPTLGGYFAVSAFFLQDALGAAINLPVQVTKMGPEVEKYVVEAEEYDFDEDLLDAIDSTKTVTIDADVNNVNFRSLFDALYPEPQSGDTVRCVVSSGVVVGSTSTSSYAFDVGSWPAGVTVEVVVYGTIAGAGGAGGAGSGYNSNGGQGQPGGTALYTRQAISLYGTGTIGGGGGGGGGGATNGGIGGGGGGGGRGRIGGAGGGVSNGYYGAGNPGNAGTVNAAGTGGAASGSNWGAVGGNGGDFGMAGQTGGSASGSSGVGGAAGYGTGGAAGNAIDGDSYVTETGSLTVSGSRVN